MTRWLLVALGVLGVAMLMWFFFFRTPSVTNYPSAGTDIVAIGDSLVYGTGSSKGNDFVSLLSKHIGQPIANLGVPGDTTADVVARLNKLDAYKPKVVIVLVGGNDYLKRVQDDEVFSNLQTIVTDIQKRGAIVLLVGIRGGVLSDPYAARFKELARTYGTAYVQDALSGLLGNKEYMADQVHPNDQGYRRLAERIAPVLSDLLQ
jgi:acyl-CoA thioesterase-1